MFANCSVCTHKLLYIYRRRGANWCGEHSKSVGDIEFNGLYLTMVVLTKEQIEMVEKSGIWLPQMEKDACGVGFVTSIKGVATHKILESARTMLERMAHRGACSCDNDSGDGAGVLTAIPDDLYRNEIKKHDDINLPPLGEYATGMLFLDQETYRQAKEAFTDLAKGCNLKVIAWRRPETHSEQIGTEARKTEPCIRQVSPLLFFQALHY
ncbi:Glutamate synthase 2 [NADH], chloroplastic [Toxocara canis]|uniref:glutamate synthase (ferredoxin) n=1 Tax=Toxocara canis TaxID=6265 RepID=A0A0B2VX78_TOXCA|nr:Glutamate synthase 2 [NADH], chloroplastic [Toxocara canis]